MSLPIKQPLKICIQTEKKIKLTLSELAYNLVGDKTTFKTLINFGC